MTGLGDLVHVRDPGHADLRKATRVAVVLPAVFALGLLVGNESFALFAGFGAFGLLSFADFGGPLRRRARAYLVFGLVGVAIVVVGTAVSQHLVLAVGASLVVVFAIQYVGVFGGYWAAATVPATLAFVLAVMIPGPLAHAVPQAGGWLAAGVAAAAGAVALWPLHERKTIRRQAAAACEQVAALVDAWDQGRPPDELQASVDELITTSRRLGEAWGGNRLRPAGPARRDQALAYLVDEARQLTVFARRLAGPVDAAGSAALDRALVVRAATTLRAAAELLRHGVDRIDLEGLDAARQADLADLEVRAAADAPGAEVVATVERSFDLRSLTHLTLSIAANARIVGGGEVDGDRYLPPAAVPVGTSATSTAARARALLGSQLTWSSAWLRNTVRSALAIAAAVGVARVIEVDHGFWVALGTLSVLRSSAVGTALNALQAIGGTVAGFALTVPVLWAVDDRTALLWPLLVVTTFLAAWTPTAIHFVVGQASFTLFVVVLFDLVDPGGWQTGLVRLEDIAIGVAVAVAVGLVVWPRGVTQQLGHLVAEAQRAAADHLVAALGCVVRGAGEPRAERARARAALGRADEALLLVLSEGHLHEVDPDDLVRLLLSVARLRQAGDALGWIRAARFEIVGCDGAVRDLLAQADTERQRVHVLADQLDGRSSEPVPAGEPGPAAGGDLLASATAQVVDPASRGDARSTVAVVFAAGWLRVASDATTLATGPAEAVGRLRSRPWWR